MGPQGGAANPLGEVQTGAPTKKGQGGMVSAIFHAKTHSGWSLPMEAEVGRQYEGTKGALARFYVDANEELYRLVEAMGPRVGWEGRWEEAPPRPDDDVGDVGSRPRIGPRTGMRAGGA